MHNENNDELVKVGSLWKNVTTVGGYFVAVWKVISGPSNYYVGRPASVDLKVVKTSENNKKKLGEVIYNYSVDNLRTYCSYIGMDEPATSFVPKYRF